VTRRRCVAITVSSGDVATPRCGNWLIRSPDDHVTRWPDHVVTPRCGDREIQSRGDLVTRWPGHCAIGSCGDAAIS